MKGLGIMMLVILIAITGFLLYYSGSFLIGQAAIVGGESCTVREGESVCPLVAYYECAPASGGTQHTDITISSGVGYYSTSCNVYSMDCIYTVSQLPFGVSSIGYYTGSNPTIRYLSVGQSVTIPRTYTIYFGRNFILGGDAKIDMGYLPFTLWSDSSSGGRVEVFKNQWGCNLPGKVLPGTGYVTDCGDADDCNPSYVYTQKDFLNFYEAVNYVDIWADCPADLNYKFMPNFITYGQVYCAGDGRIFSIGSTEINGNCYAFPKAQIGKVDCCPGSIGLCANNVACGADGKCPVIPPPCTSCFSDFQCVGMGSWILNPSNQQQAIRGSCVSSCCEVTTKAITITCTGTQKLFIDSATGEAKCLESGQPPIPPSPQPQPETCDLWCWLMNIITAFVIGAVVSGLVMLASKFLPIPFASKLRSWKMFVIISIVVGLLVLFVYTASFMQVRAMLFGGI